MLADNVVHFARVLRHAGLAVGPDRVLAALEAIEAVGLARRDDVHAALSAVMIDRHEQQALFDDAFAAFWRDPKLLERMMAELLPKITGRGDRANKPRSHRLADALAPTALAAAERPPARPDEGVEFETSFAFSERERLQGADFESMTAAEFELAKKLAEEVPLPFAPVQRRRHAASGRGRIDLRATMLAMARQPETLVPRFSRPRSELPAIVVLLDVSGSMDRYARLMLHYVHGLTRRYLKVHTLTFGTRLTNITRALRHRDPDLALEMASEQVRDWKGGTRIASCLDDFNRHWARRLLGANAALLLVTDGLDRDEHGELTRAAQQLRLFARQIVWLNPLLRFDRFEPRAGGVRALLPHVDRFLPVHNLASLADLATALRSAPAPRRR
ncbi:MAG: VWA domain-containing protein [Caldimonas sp.]